MQQLAFLPNIGGMEWAVIGIVALLIFGRRLPEVGRSLGKGIVEFKKGIRGIEDEIESESSRSRPAIAADPPLTSSGEDARVGQADPLGQSHAESAQGEDAPKTD
ncbi:MAG: twin-arginine translocase TatA/TatE family subunit [Planctomycetes bacterium]|nr:twin-arginine translocase TatA/TatE family subunit [Planctomycetota bacterium]MCH9058946.1 twin-arginine translocase TatA/TatE family subunit [Planctomycetota bacterium]